MMAPNVLGNTLLIADTCIEPGDQNNNQIKANKSILNVRTSEPVTTVTARVQTEELRNNSSPEASIRSSNSSSSSSSRTTYETVLVWRNIIAFIYLHSGFLYGGYLLMTSAKISTFLLALALGMFGAFGITAGAHRLWSHRSYKAKWPLRLILMLSQTLAFQNSIYEWVRDHRVHHKFTDTDADPHNARRGFFFSHIGWLMVKKHPDVKARGKAVDMSDLETDGIVMFQKKYYAVLMPLFCFAIPTYMAYHFLDETFSNSWYIVAIFRYVLSLNGTWLVNSAAHIWGTKPYDKNISPTNNTFVGIAAVGEGWHNYHHVFPWDYKTSELGKYSTNLTTAVIDGFAWLGWAYDLKSVSDEMIKKRVLRTGDGTHQYSESQLREKMVEYVNQMDHENESALWGWDDADMNEEDRMDATVSNKID
ncbi:acyl-CoA Delta-9 desaturase isoform X2 [Toxorhynchites rutilus septentrionalis]|nr:acyl-CoA Delta-9 desaturase isoform X2 [Toxorhynchites rutilus septentrionalis]XP_055633551.1 acyl-CoA Delta-9 desaturase isoform X2 [Toxorhynchites rutilus septentrionalis]